MVFALAVASCLAQNPKVSDFPTSVAVDQTLLVAKDLSQSTLSGGINNSTLTVVVADGTMFLGYELIRIDDEQLTICSISTNTLTICTRGYGGTTAASHLSGAAVRGIITSSHHNQLAAEVKSMQARLRDATGYCADAGSNDTYACSPAPCITSYSAGNRFWFKANTANTGAATVNFCSVGAKTIKKAVGGVTTDLADNDIRAGQYVEVIYDGTNMQMLSVLGNAAASAAWGSITGTLSGQSDLQSALNAKLTTATGQAGTPTYCRSTTGNDTYGCGLTPALTAYTTGSCLVLNPDTANTLAASVNVDSLGAKSILNRAGGALATGDITANKPITICYDGTQYIIQGDGGGSGSGDAVKSEVQSGSYLTCSVGSGGSPYACTMTPTLTAYTDGMAVRFIRTGGTAETGSVTLNIDSLGATAIKKHGGTTNPGDFCNIPAGPVSIVLTYNSANSVFWLPPCPGDNNRGDAVSGANLQYGAYTYSTTGGTSTAYTASLANSLSGGSAPALGAYANGETFTIKFNANSGANPTLNIDSLGAKKIYMRVGRSPAVQVAADDLIANRVYSLAYNTSLDGGSGGFEVATGDTRGRLDNARTSATVLTFGSDCSSTYPCNVGAAGSTMYPITASFTVTISTGTGNLYVYKSSAGTTTVAKTTGDSMDPACSAGCTVGSAITAFPVDSTPIYLCTATSSATWDSPACVDYRPAISRPGKNIICSTNMTCVETATGVTLSSSGSGSSSTIVTNQGPLSAVSMTGSYVDLFSNVTLAANTLGTNGCIGVHVKFTNSASTDLRFKFGSTTFAMGNMGADSNIRNSFKICSAGGSTSAQQWLFDMGGWHYGTNQSSGTYTGYNATTEDSTTALTINMQASSATGGATVTPINFLIWKIQ